MEHIQISRAKRSASGFRQCLFWIHAQKKGKMAKSQLCFEEMGGKKGQRKQMDKGRKTVKYKETLKWCVEKHNELPKQMDSNTLFDTCSPKALLLLLRATGVTALGYLDTLNLLDTPI